MTDSDALFKTWIPVVSVLFKPWNRDTLAEAAETASTDVDSFSHSPDPAYDVPIVENEFVVEGSPWDLGDLTSKNDRGLSALQQIQDLCQTYGLSVRSNVWSVQVLRKDTLGAFASAGDDETCLADLKESLAVKKADLKKSLASFEER